MCGKGNGLEVREVIKEVLLKLESGLRMRMRPCYFCVPTGGSVALARQRAEVPKNLREMDHPSKSVPARRELKGRVQVTLEAAQVNLNFSPHPNVGVPQYHPDLC